MDWFEIMMSVLVGGLILFLVIGGGMIIVDEMAWSKVRPIKITATLLSSNYKDSTLETHAVPTFNTNGSMGVGMVTTGDSESYVTVWDCGKYGRLKADDEEIFRWAKPKSELWIKERGSDIRIVGIEQ